MTDNNEQPQRTIDRNVDCQNLENDMLDRGLDIALEKYAAVEPRAGLEERVMANLQAEQKLTTVPAWWQWPAVTALAALALVLAVGAFFAWRFEKPSPAAKVYPLAAPTQANSQAGVETASNSGSGSRQLRSAVSKQRLNPHTHGHNVADALAAPKLDQFPSPQPLNPQEEMLAEYVSEHHQQAILVSRDRLAELKREWPQADSSLLTSNLPAMPQEIDGKIF